LIEEILRDKLRNFLEKNKRLRREKSISVFERRYIISPEDFVVTNYPRKPVAVFNPAALLLGREVYVFPRLVFDYYNYTSSIGFFKISIEELLEGSFKKPIEIEIMLWPKEIWEFLGCEDPRVFVNENIIFLYTGKGYIDHNMVHRDVLAISIFDKKWVLKKKGFFKIVHEDETYIPKSSKDSAFVRLEGSKGILLTRPHIDDIMMGWRCEANLEELTIPLESLEPVFPFEEWETKTGWSTNTVKISEGEYFVGWHAVLKKDLSYRNGLAIVDEKGCLLGTTDYILEPEGLVEEYGDRALVIFGDGLLMYEDSLIWIGGVGDYAIGVFIAKKEKVMQHMKDV